MKSLEIINSKIKQIKKDLYKLGKTKEGSDKDFYKYVLTEGLKDYQCVKQDLEVLEIIRKSHLGDDDIFIRFLIASYIDIDKYNKVKQWLEE